MRSILYTSTNQHEQCVLNALRFLPRRRTETRAVLLLRAECCVVLEAFFHFVWEQEAGSACRPAIFFRGSCSTCSPVSCTLYANDSTERHKNRHMCIVRLATPVVVSYGDVPMRRPTSTRKIHFFHGGANLAQTKNLCQLPDRITDQNVVGLGFGYFLQLTENRRHSSVGYLLTDRSQSEPRCPTLPRQ